MKILITENQLRKVQFKFLNYLFEDMYEIESKYYLGSKIWKKDDEVVLELEESGQLRVLHSIWNDISNMFSLDYDETKQLIQEWAEQHLELEGITSLYKTKFYHSRWNNI